MTERARVPDGVARRRNIAAIRAALDRHNTDCPVPAAAILLHPSDHQAFEIRNLWGLPVKADPRVGLRRCRIACPGSAWEIEEELAAYLELSSGTSS